jgi:hippurate hydrolase
MAAADFFDITVRGYGSHAARPHESKDPIVAAMALGQALQTIVSRNANPLQAVVVSITQIHGGSAYNIIPDEVKLAGTVRTFSNDLRVLARERMRAIADGIAAAYGVEIEIKNNDIFSVLNNHEKESKAVAEIAEGIVGKDNVLTAIAPRMGSEDFADMLHAVPGAYFWLGHEGSVPLHNPGFVLDDGILPVGASLLARIVESRLPAA